MLCEANPRVLRKLMRAGVLQKLGAGRYFETFVESMRSWIEGSAGKPMAVTTDQ
jgi:hypothetical protein